MHVNVMSERVSHASKCCAYVACVNVRSKVKIVCRELTLLFMNAHFCYMYMYSYFCFVQIINMLSLNCVHIVVYIFRFECIANANYSYHAVKKMR